MKTENIGLVSQGNRLTASLDLPEGADKIKFVVACHGLFSTKDSEKWTAVGERLTRIGYGLLRLDFGGCGESEGSIEESTVSGRLEDLETALYYVKEHPAFTPPIGLVGSSLGGFLALAKASAGDEIGALVAMATPAAISPSPEVASSLKEKGYYQYPDFRLKKAFWEDGARYDLTGMSSKISCPSLLIHGDRDEQVPVDNSRILFENLKCEKRLEILRGGDHRLSEPSHREHAIRLTAHWLFEHMPP
jgi:pimeloyl-ACP methyl ester carboxylesterase